MRHLDIAAVETGTFDAINPPRQDLIDDCVHCGFCLSACPTYALWGEEMDSPRGRIYLMKLGREGATSIDSTFVRHFDACLGCMACVTACPSGVKYDELVEAVRPQIERNFRRGFGDRVFRALVFQMFPRPGRMRVAASLGLLYQRMGVQALLRLTRLVRLLPARLAALEQMLPPVSWAAIRTTTPELTPATGPRRRRVGLLTGCIQRVFFGEVNAATVRVLAAEGCEVVAPRTQGCCGALLMHSGLEGEAAALARATIDCFERQNLDAIVVNAAGCGSAMKDYGRLLSGDPAYAGRAVAFASRVRDVSEVLAELEPVAPRRAVHARVAYHDACHLSHAQGVRQEPRMMLSDIPGLTVLEVPDGDMCCGSAGIYNLVQPVPAAELGRRKAAAILSLKPDLVAAGNPGCLLQLRSHLAEPIPLVHPVQLVDAAIRGDAIPTSSRSRR